VPVWALEWLGAWTGMTVYGEVAAPPRLGPLPSTAELGRRLTDLDHGLLRSAFTGQANAILVSPALAGLGAYAVELNSPEFRRAQARVLGLDVVARLAWAKERRVCQAVRVRLEDGRGAFVANLHATGLPDDRLADAELLRAASFADGLARPDEICVLAGDFNVWPHRSRTLADLQRPEWGFPAPGPRLDQVLVRRARASAPEAWPEGRRRVGGRLLSDHAPVEVRIG
jgi:endonuclease/exonuclease/phosphatase family metal-dependent hydrolase